MDFADNASSVSVGDLINTRFIDNTINYSGGINGGALVGAQNAGAAIVGSIASTASFTGNVVRMNDINSGGLVGAMSFSGNAELGVTGGVGGSYIGNRVTTTGADLSGGGLLGAHVDAGGGSATVGDIVAGTTFGGSGVGEANIVTSALDLTGGGLVGAYAYSGAASVGSIAADVAFTGNTVTAKGEILGGGLVGAYSADSVGSASLGVSGGVGGSYIGNSVETTTGYLEGGGLLGAYVGSGSGAATVGDIVSGTTFGGSGAGEGNIVTVAGALYGGGLVGAYATSARASMGSIASTASFTGNAVTADNSLSGGGLVGAYSSSVSAELGVSGGVGGSYKGNAVESTTGSLSGGGLLGAYSNAQTTSSTVGDIVAGATFGGSGTGEGNTITVGDDLYGGGLIGARTAAGVGSIAADAAFTGNAVTVSYAISGGGLVGAYSADAGGSASLGVTGGVGGSYAGNSVESTNASLGVTGGVGGGYIGNSVETTGGSLSGGGLLGAYVSYNSGNATVGNIVADTTFGGSGAGEGNSVAVATTLTGGGLVGAYANTGVASVGSIDATASFTGSEVKVAGALSGGGLAGAASLNGSASLGVTGGVGGSYVANSVETTNNNLSGGGLLGAYAGSGSGAATVGNIVSGTVFGGSGTGAGNTLSIHTSLFGGGLVGTYADSGAAGVGSIASGVSFAGNRVTANASFGGGLVGAYADSGSAELGVSGGVGGAYKGNTVTTGSLFGGGLLGTFVNDGTGSAAVGDIVSGTLFGGSGTGEANVVDSVGAIMGGGLVGAYADTGAASAGSIASGISFAGNQVTAGDTLTGGGLIGAYSRGGSAELGVSGGVGGNYKGNTVKTSTNEINGGGLLGAYVGSGSGAATVGNIVSGTVFGGSGTGEANVVESSTLIAGGGLIGARSYLGVASVDSIASGVSFTGNQVTTDTSLEGGGLAGAHSRRGSAELGVAGGIGGNYKGNAIGVGTVLFGGGLLGAYISSGSGSAAVGDIVSGTTFGGSGTGEANVIDADLSQGGGLVGAYASSGTASVGSIASGVSFAGNRVTVNSSRGGGLVGAYADSGTASVGSIAATASFTGSEVTADSSVLGGGLAGAASMDGSASLGVAGGVGGSYQGNTVKIKLSGSLSGGGLLGVYAGSGSGAAAIGSIASGVSFAGNEVTAGNLSGGGIVGAFSRGGMAKTDTISASFADNVVTVGGSLVGGGVLGASSQSATTSLGNLIGASFTGNRIAVGGQAAAGEGYATGGVIGAGGLDSAWTIADTVVTGNSLTVSNHRAEVTSGIVYVGTDHATANGSHAVTVNGDSLFSGNTVSYSGGAARANSFHFGREWFAYSLRDSVADASLTLAPGAGETVSLRDPISVDMNNGKAFAYTVAATSATGRVELNGLSLLDAAGGATFTAQSGVLALGSTFSLARGATVSGGGAAVNSGGFDVSLDNTSSSLRLEFDLDGRDAALAMFDRPDSFTVTNNPGAAFTGVAVSVSSRTFSPVSTYDKWLVTDNRGTVDATDFTLTNPSSGLEFLVEGTNLYISGLSSIAPDSVRKNRNPNVLSSYRSGALSDAWQAAKAELALSQAETNALFDSIAANPRRMTAEAFASRGLAALDSAKGMWQGARSLAGLTAPGGWQRDETLLTSAASETAAASLCPTTRRGPSFWAGSFATKTDSDSRDGLEGFDGKLYGAAVGGTYVFDQVWRGGLHFAYGRDKSDFDGLGAENRADGWQVGGFVEGRLTPRWGMRLDVAHTWFDNELKHTTPVGRYKADFDQRVFGLGFETGYDFRPGDGLTRLTPFAGVWWQHLSQDRGAEKALGGAPNTLASSLSSLSADSLVTSLGMEAARDIRLSCGRTVTPSLRAAWTHEFGDDRIRGRGGYDGFIGTYRVVSLGRSRDTADIAARIAARVRENSGGGGVDVSVGVDASFGRRYVDYGFRVGLGVEF